MNMHDELNAPGALDEVSDFGEPDTEVKKSIWKRELLFGYSLPWLLGATLLILAGAVYVYRPSLPFLNTSPSATAFAEVDSTLDGVGHGQTNNTASSASASPGIVEEAPTVNATQHTDTMAMMTDIRDELNDRDNKIYGSLAALKDSVSQLSDAIKRDEAYAVETRNQLNAMQQRLTAMESRQAVAGISTPTAKTAGGKRQAASAVSGMTVMSMENGMAWIKWQGSTWAVREGDTLGKVTIRQIDTVGRTVVTTGGTLH